METRFLSKDRMNNIYDLLVTIGGANEDDRSSFIYHHCEDEYGCSEWRFRGKFGFGGKYRSYSNCVTYYPEDETQEMKDLCSYLNNELSKV